MSPKTIPVRQQHLSEIPNSAVGQMSLSDRFRPISINNLMSEDFEIMLYPTQCDDSEHFNLQDEHLAQSEAKISRI